MVPRGTFIGYKNTSAIRTPLKIVNGYKNSFSAERTVNKNVLAVLIETEKKRLLYNLIALPFGRFEETTKNKNTDVRSVNKAPLIFSIFCELSYRLYQSIRPEVFRDTERKRDDLLFGSFIFRHSV